MPKANGSGYCAVGDIALNSFYISADKQSIRIGNWETAEQEARFGPCKKKLDVEYWQVTWNLNEGAWPTNDNHATQVAKDGKLAAPAKPVKSDYNFGGWYKEASLANQVNFPYDMSTITDNFTLYAKWVTPPDLTGTVTITGNAIVGSTLKANTDNLDGSGVISYQWIRCDTEDADGTNITPNGTGNAYTLIEADVDKYIKVTVSRTGYLGKITSAATKAVTISPYAEYFGTWRWTPHYETWRWYQITVNTDKIVCLDYDGYIYTIGGLTWTEIVNKNDYTSDYPVGYKIAGNYGGFIGLCISIDKQSIMQASFNIYGGQEFWLAELGPYFKKLDATETEFWQVTYELNGGKWEGYVPATFVPKDGGIDPPYPTKTGYDFGGWYLDAALTNKVTFPYDVSSVTENFTLYAKWIKQPNIAFVARNPVTESLYSNGFFIGSRLNFDLIVYDDAGLTSITITEEATGAPNGNKKTFSQTREIPISGPGTYQLSQEIVRSEIYGNIYNLFNYTVSAYGKSYSRNYSGDYSSYNGAWSHYFVFK